MSASTSSPRRPLAALLAGALLAPASLLVGHGPAGAAVIPVGPAEADLRAALATAAANGEADELVLTAGVTYDLTCDAGGELLHDEDQGLTIDGNGATIRQTCADERVLLHDSTALLELRDLTITGGNTSADGGGVSSEGPVTAIGSTFDDNSNGAIEAAGDVTLVASTISNNTHADGIIVSAAPGLLTVLNTTVTGNTSTNNSILFGEDGVALAFATIAGNSGTEHVRTSFLGAGSDPRFESFASVITGTDDGGDACDIADDAPITSFGYNHIADDTCGLTEATDTESAGDPLLGALGANGGPTLTRLPAAGSPLLDAIEAGDCALGAATNAGTDQRGVVRPQGAGCDIGAVEVEVAAVPEVPEVPEVPSSPAAPAAPVTARPTFTG